jgi:hypothetical protein
MKYGRALGLALVCLLVLLPHYVDSCSFAPPELRFTTYHNPLPGEFSSGRVGVLRPHYRRRYLLLAYRELSGVPLTSDEIQVQAPEPAGGDVRIIEAWLDARKLVPGAAAIASLPNEKRVPGQDYETFSNCLADAFTTAAATLLDRVKQWGAASPQTAGWLRAQDQVFQNCGGGPAIPDAAPAGNKLLAEDRDYQIAAAQMYAGYWDQARSAFDRIAADVSSPWRDTARYVAARVSIRQATLGKDAAKFRDAGTRLEAIAKDPAAGPWQARAQALLGFVRASSEPARQLTELADRLMKPGSGQQLERVLEDYTAIWDHIDNKEIPRDNDLAHWIDVFQSEAPALDTWREKKTLPWLIAALRHSDSPDLIAAARGLKPDSPAWDSATYYGILAQIRSGNGDAARAWADTAIAAKPEIATLNLVRGERLKLSRDWTEFLRFAPRRPVTAMSDDDDLDAPIDTDSLKRKPVALDEDSVGALNHVVPLSLLIDATSNSLMPENLQADIAQAAWVRAVVLGDVASARTLAERLAKLKPELAGEMAKYLAEKDSAASRFTATFLMLRAPGLEPLVRAGFGRETSVLKSDIMRDNWWLLKPAESASGMHQALIDLYPDGHFGPVDFLPPAKRAQGEKEWQDLNRVAANSVNYLCANAIEWARAHPRDARVPQALHLAVEATHYGPSEKSSPYSRQAFELLHRAYPNSEWTQRTKYWY